MSKTDSHLNILLISGEKNVYDYLKQLLTTAKGFAFELAHIHDPAAPFNFINQKIDTIILDLNLFYGIDLKSLSQLRANFPDVPVIVISTDRNPDQVAYAIKTGAQDFLLLSALDNESLPHAIISAITRMNIARNESINSDKSDFAQIVNDAPVAIAILDSHEIIYSNNKLGEILGVSNSANLINKSFMHHIHPSYLQFFNEWVSRIQRPDSDQKPIHIILLKHDNYPVNVEIAGKHIEYKSKSALLMLISDITERKQIETDTLYAAKNNSLANIIDNQIMHNYIDNAILASQRNKTHFAIMCLDLDHLKVINETYGRRVGDLLLQSILQRLKKVARQTDTVLSLGGNHFIVAMNDIDNINVIPNHAQHILTSLTQPFMINSHHIEASFTAGISIYPENGTDANTLIKNADLAHYKAKQRGQNTYMIFTPSMAHHAKLREELLYDLKGAIRNNEFLLFYQPIINSHTGKIARLEALLRWFRHSKEILLPGDFLTLAEETGLIFDINEWVIREACKQDLFWQAKGLKPVPISINLSLSHFHLNSKLLHTITDIMTESSLPPDCLEFEMSENVTVLDVGLDIISALKRLNIKLTIDDFGANFFSLNELMRYHIDNIKIDRSLISSTPDDSDKCAIVSAIIAMAAKLNINVFAEGIENQKQLSFLNDAGCQYVQGNYLCPPLSAEQLFMLLKQDTSFPFTPADTETT